jgi:hypothetical protein
MFALKLKRVSRKHVLKRLLVNVQVTLDEKQYKMLKHYRQVWGQYYLQFQRRSFQKIHQTKNLNEPETLSFS